MPLPFPEDMFKSKLQVLCQQNSWDLPVYTTAKDGPSHNPRFAATVTVNGLPFDTPDQSRTAKEAQNKAARLAFQHFSAPTPPVNRNPVTASPQCMSSSDRDLQSNMRETKPIPLMNDAQIGVKDDDAQIGVKDAKKFIEMKHLYKNRLQSYAQKRNLTLPEYSCEREGPPHASRFKCKVTIEGKTYETLEYFSTIKDAEHAAAKVAWESLSPNEVREDDSALYKNLLQELAQKEGLRIPKYETTVSGPPHMPIFVSSVEMKGQSFEGQAAKSKKQAEMSAAKVAYIALQEQWKNEDEENTAGGELLIPRMPELKDKGEERTACDEPVPAKMPGAVSVIPTVLPPGCQIKEALKASSSILQSVISGDSQQGMRMKSNRRSCRDQDDECIGGSEEKFSSVYVNGGPTRVAEDKVTPKPTAVNGELRPSHAPSQLPEEDINTKRPRSSASSDMAYVYLRDAFTSTASSLEDGASSSMRSECSADSCMNSKNESTVVRSTDTLPRAKNLVYPRVPNMKFPEGATVLPFSDDKWVALEINGCQ